MRHSFSQDHLVAQNQSGLQEGQFLMLANHLSQNHSRAAVAVAKRSGQKKEDEEN